MPEIKIEKKLLRDGITQLSLDGELDAHTSPTLDKAITDLLAAGSAKIVLDLQKLVYISSNGIGVLVSALAQCHDLKGNVVLMQPGPMVREIFEMLEVTHLFPVVDNQEAALAAF
jgi:anti-sigma B factor antagonist